VPTHTDQAICIRQWDWSETSQTVSLFAREHGLLRAVAKGSKREHSRFSGGLEILTRGEMIAIIKPSAEMANLIAWDLQETFPALRRSLPAFYSGMYIADLVQSALTEHDPHPPLFDAALEALRLLGQGHDRAAVLAFQWATLAEAGYRPEITQDVASGEPLEPARTYLFLPRLGGFAADRPQPQAPAWRARSETLEALRRLSTQGVSGVTTLSAETLDRAARLLALYLREILGRDMASMEALFGEIQA
jgi:DNA repair protein RecO (recombination protein O)